MAEYFESHHLAAAWGRRADAVDPHARALVRQLGRTMLATALGYLNRLIYSIPEAGWRRTGQLVARERLEYDADGLGVSLLNPTPYAEIRHEMGKPGRRFTTRFAPWRDFTVLAIQRVKPALLAELGGKILTGDRLAGFSASEVGIASEGGSGGGARAQGQATLTPRGGPRSGPSGGRGEGGGGGGGGNESLSPFPAKRQARRPIDRARAPRIKRSR